MNGTRQTKPVLAWANHRLELGKRTHVMGILNVTPDSFSDGGHFFSPEKAIEHGLAMARDGADIIDVGGESTRPFSQGVPLDEELDRVIPVIGALCKDLKIPISVDTVKSEVALEALKVRASLINDISALRFDPRMVRVASDAGVPVILMHMKGTPSDMQQDPTYDDLIGEILDFLKQAMARAVEGGIKEDRIIVDPGIGFGKSFDHNLELIGALDRFQALQRPVLLGTSRKGFLGYLLNKEPLERDTGTMATIAAGVMNGAHLVRVHNVKMAVDTVRVIDAIRTKSISRE